MKVGDLVRWKPDIPMMWPPNYGIIVKVVDQYVVGVIWVGCTHIYKEPIKQLEVISEKATKEHKKGILNKKQICT
jgi:hypothetical protein